MDALKMGDRVEHVTDASRGVGLVKYVEEVAGDRNVYVLWESGTEHQRYTEAQLRAVKTLPERLADAGPGALVPFQLKVMGRWFEERHEIAGEISNQPFDMLPHQVIVAHRVLSSPPAEDGGRHWLIADDVGLGKTIEAGMILEVMRRRAGGSLRCLVVAPAGLTLQWKTELAVRFGRNFEIFAGEVNKLESCDQLIAPIDTLKLVLKNNKDALAVTPWDLVMFDEAHHLTKPGVQKYELANHLREAKKARNVLLLTATPHSGNHEHFVNLLRLLRPDKVTVRGPIKTLPDLPLAEMVIRNRKALVTDAKGKKIFHGIAKSHIISFKPSPQEIAFADEIHDYLQHGYGEANKLDNQSKAAVGFLMATFGKLASSSREALRAALEGRRAILTDIHDAGDAVAGAGNVSEFDANLRQRAPRLPGFDKAPAQSNSIGWQWYPRATYADAEDGIVDSYAARVAKCDIDNYRPFKADRHWPRLMTQVPQASLWGHSPGGPETLFATDLVWQFGTGSTALHDARLHEGLDVNWRFKADPFVDPAYRGIYGNVADTYCFGKSLLTGDVEVPLKCPVPDPNNEGKYVEEDQDNPIAHCPAEELEAKDKDGNYDDDSGCNPAERIWEDIKAKCGGQLKSCTDVCESWGPFKVICWVGSCTYAGFKTIAECSNELWVSQADFLGAYLGTLGCQALDAVPCSPSQLRLFRRHDGNQHHEMEIELEHRLTYGKKDGLDLCEPAFNGGCAYQEGYKPGNEYHGNGINVSLDKDLKSLFDAPTGPAQVYPFTNIPGMVNQSSGVLARFAQTSGFSDTPPPVLGIAPDAVAQFAALPQNSKHPLLQTAFRAQFIGDLIVDCGHNPIRTEIHPPTSILLHATPHPDLLSASGAAASPARRYTLWGWKRHNDFTSPPSYDLWPGPRPKGATSIAFKILQPVGASQLTGFSCSPVPSYAPNRIVCVPSGGGATSGQQDMVCAHNPRMLPSCAETSGGGLVEVYWQ